MVFFRKSANFTKKLPLIHKMNIDQRWHFYSLLYHTTIQEHKYVEKLEINLSQYAIIMNQQYFHYHESHIFSL